MFGAAGFLIAFLAGGMMAFWGGLLGVVSAGILLFKLLLRNR
jgi:prolipoprotein diacylglyceryltransferase